MPLVYGQALQSDVTITETTISWETVAFTLNDDLSVSAQSVNLNQTEIHTFTAYILENEYLRVTLVPEYGGRILSIVDKETGHEQLYQNPLGLPYGIGDGNFYYDWLMVYGGIFPTFPTPEHGKTWFLPWSFEVVEESSGEVIVQMSFVDDITYNKAPSRFNKNATGLEVDFIISLKAGHRAVDTTINIHNPTDDSIRYEYWTCITLAPGSDIGNTLATAETEIVAPIGQIKMPPWWPRTTAQEEPANITDVYTFNNLRKFENWADMGIAYGYPSMEDTNFWGVINQDNQEGIVRIADNTVSPGLKIWTWGFDSANVDPMLYMFDERRPYIELWAGVTTEFFKQKNIASGETVTVSARYAVSTGLNNITHASRDVLANFYSDNSNQVHLEVAGIQPEQILTANIIVNGQPIHSSPTTLTTTEIVVQLPDTVTEITFALVADDGTEILSGMIQENDTR